MSLLEYRVKLRNMAEGTSHRHEALIRCDGGSVDVVMGPYAVSVEFDKRDGDLAADDVLHVGVYSADDFSREDPLAPPQVFSLSGEEPVPIRVIAAPELPVKFEPEGAPFARCPRCDAQSMNTQTHTLLECFQELNRRLRVLEEPVK